MNKQQLLDELTRQGIQDPQVLAAIEKISRQDFVPEEQQQYAYANDALPIGYEQTISQPYVVALMTQAILKHHPKKVLEVGTGSGYQAAILSLCVESVYTVERIKALYEFARVRFSALELENIHSFYGDGYEGLAAEAPFDAILVAARAPEVPKALLDQLTPQGCLVMPMGDEVAQELVLVTRQDEQWHYQSLGAVVFVPLQPGIV
ncbi:MAG: protein-L-isoaspartate(D-aspartate) O-methyltransferase [Gammaproteobacteria bacterium]|jgi:protein-L-isoaspartate(D-aspartate) O-methyltransferase|nr:protein-L-isoaspartate(D-aspartate) O-methyltransferase [Gammaproteobacteria bacterium]